MSEKTLADLRKQLFETTDALRDPKQPMEIGRAKQIGNLAQVIVNSAKVEVDYMRATGAKDKSSFIDGDERGVPDPKKPGVLGVTTHRLRG